MTDNQAVDPTVPHNSRVWNYWLGGKDNYEADRRLGDKVAEMFPVIRLVARADREFLRNAVGHLAGPVGIRQFLDVGTGLPTADNTHEVAQRTAPDARIVYVDNDPLVLAHARALLTSTPEGSTHYRHADAREPEKIIEVAAQSLDFDAPVAVMLLSILHFFEEDEARRIVGSLMAAVPSGSHLVIAHATRDLADAEIERALDAWNSSSRAQMHPRSHDAVERLTEGLELLPPGVVSCARWRPDGLSPDAPQVPQYGLVARKP